jgi:hypothetical protein
MKVKTPKNSPIEVLYKAAKEIVDGTRKVFRDSGKNAEEVRLPILIGGTDMRVTIEAGPKIAARNAIEQAQVKASGNPAPSVDAIHALNEAKALLAQYASDIKDSNTVGGQWMTYGGKCEEQLYERCMTTVKSLFEVERLL